MNAMGRGLLEPFELEIIDNSKVFLGVLILGIWFFQTLRQSVGIAADKLAKISVRSCSGAPHNLNIFRALFRPCISAYLLKRNCLLLS